jgi:Xaa-Pro dipeptidase
MLSKLYRAHVAERRRRAAEALEAEGFDALIVHSGTPQRYFADDQDAPFRTTPHFAHWVPLAGPHHLLLVRKGKKPLLVRVAPEDYWYEQAPLGDPFWRLAFEFVEVGSSAAAWQRVRPKGRVAFVGDAAAEARAHGIPRSAIQPPRLMAHLDWGRSYKSDYEVACLVEATKLGASGHLAARAAFESGASELEIHQVYVGALGCTDEELPYPTIVALDAHGATLHYTGKRSARNGKVLLLDAGARFLGYGSDITRTWVARNGERTFAELVDGLDQLQRRLCGRVQPGLSYPELHHEAHVEIGELLRALGVLRVGGAEAFARGLTRAFFPHGLGHFLGIQVHDVSGHQRGPAGGRRAPPSRHPYLRTTRTIEEHMVFTVEPGVYFIEMLLRPHRTGRNKAAVDWKLVDVLKRCGGARIEDNVLVTREGHRNLTRPYV